MKKKLLTTGEIAKHCNVTDRAVLKWVASGKIKCYRTPGRHSRVKFDDFIAFLNQFNMPIPEELGREKKRILVVEDDKLTARLIQKLLQKNLNCEVEVTYDGFSAGFMINEFKPDLITLDIMMPMVDGYEVVSRVRNTEEYKDMQILVVTAVEDIEAENKMASLGANDFIRKPIEAKVLLEKVSRLLAFVKMN